MTVNRCVLEGILSGREKAKTKNRGEIINMIKSEWQMTGNSRRSGLAVGVQTMFVFVLLITVFFAAPQSTSADTSLNPVGVGDNPKTGKAYMDRGKLSELSRDTF
ncbi:MAG: hypothetical protein K0R67_3177 [Paenibacillus sp.]|jgi:hypothetical protein|nr:hypothetical protein [Paenibacillus sp.]